MEMVEEMKMSDLADVKAFYQQNKTALLEELKAFLSIPSISTDPKYAGEVEKAALLLSNLLSKHGADHVQILPTKGHPIVYADYLVDDNLPTVLVYGHYDVQPPEPIEKWTNPPFEPTIRNGRIYARGACDDKGQLFIHLVVLAYLKSIDYPCNIKFLFEGEEEVGSVSLEAFIQDHLTLLKADLVLISDTAILGEEQPSIISGTKGILYFELTASGPKKDIHSGIYGGGVQNPMNAISHAIHSIKPIGDQIQIPGFYDDVILPKDTEMDVESYHFYNDALKEELGVSDFISDPNWTSTQTTYFMPTFDVHGMWGGYMQDGAKTIIPHSASAKCSFRLSPGQSPQKVKQQLEQFIASLEVPGITFSIEELSACEPSFIDHQSNAFQAASLAMLETFGKAPVQTRMGGSLPIVPMIQNLLKAEVVLLGFGTDEDNIHSPDENFKLNLFEKGIETVALFHKKLHLLDRS